MNDKLTVEDLLKVIDLYQKDLNSAIADKIIAMAVLDRKEKEIEALKKQLEAVKVEGADMDGVQ